MYDSYVYNHAWQFPVQVTVTCISDSYLYELEHPGGVVHEFLALQLEADGVLQLGVAGHLQLDGGEEVVDEGEEERLVLVNQLRQVHVT